MFSSCNPKLFAVRHIHYLLHPSRDHFHADAAVPSSDNCRIETVMPPSDQYCIDIVAPSGPGGHYCIDIVVPSSDHCCTDTLQPSSEQYGNTIVAPHSDHLHTKRTQQRKLIGEKHSPTVGGGHESIQ